jgi:hypothetical protein
MRPSPRSVAVKRRVADAHVSFLQHGFNGVADGRGVQSGARGDGFEDDHGVEAVASVPDGGLLHHGGRARSGPRACGDLSAPDEGVKAKRLAARARAGDERRELDALGNPPLDLVHVEALADPCSEEFVERPPVSAHLSPVLVARDGRPHDHGEDAQGRLSEGGRERGPVASDLDQTGAEVALLEALGQGPVPRVNSRSMGTLARSP